MKLRVKELIPPHVDVSIEYPEHQATLFINCRECHESSESEDSIVALSELAGWAAGHWHGL